MKPRYLFALSCIGLSLVLSTPSALAAAAPSSSVVEVQAGLSHTLAESPAENGSASPDLPSTVLPGIAPVVRAMDDRVAGEPAAVVAGFMAQLDLDWARQWGWRPQHPVTVYSYFDGNGMADGVAQLVGHDLTPARREEISTSVAGLKLADRQNGGWAILVNLSKWYGTDRWEARTKHLLAHEYTHVMQADAAGSAGPTWMREGMAELNAFGEVPEALPLLDRTRYVVQADAGGDLPELSDLQDNWREMVSAGGDRAQLAYGESYLAVKYLAGRVGNESLLEVLKTTSEGASFEDALEQVTGYSLGRLNEEYRSASTLASR